MPIKAFMLSFAAWNEKAVEVLIVGFLGGVLHKNPPIIRAGIERSSLRSLKTQVCFLGKEYVNTKCKIGAFKEALIQKMA